MSADRDDSGCSWNWAGYRYYCYRVYDGPSRDCRYDVHSSSQNVYIESPDENDFIVKLIKEDSNHQAAGTVRLHAKHDAYTGEIVIMDQRNSSYLYIFIHLVDALGCFA